MEKRQNEAVERLVGELVSLLKMLDGESVSAATADKMVSVRNILDTLQVSGSTSDVYMNSCLYGNGTSFVESLFDGFDCDLHALSTSPVQQREEETLADKSTPTDTPPPLPTTPLPEDYYEEAVTPDPSSAPQYFTNNMDACRNSEEDAYYEDADNNYPTTRINGPPKNSYNDSDAVSSSYESYEEEDEEAKAQSPPTRWTAADESADAPVTDCRICAFLLRKKRFGQWAKQLVVVRDNKLQCYKSIKESTPHTELPLSQCSVLYVNKDGRKKKRHELRFSMPSGEVLVLAVQSREQAQRWIKVVQDVGSHCGNMDALSASASPIIQRKLEIDKMLQADRHTSDSDSGPTADCQSSTHGPAPGCGPVHTGDTLGKGKRGALSDLTGSMSRAAGKTINQIITFSKRKPPIAGEPAPSGRHDNPGCGFLNVCVGGIWKERWCTLRAGSLVLQREPGDQRSPVATVPLRGAEVVPGGLGPKHPFSFRVLHGGAELAALEASCSESLGRWLGVMLAETGSGAHPDELHYDYIDVDTLTDIRHAATHSFLWATAAAATSSHGNGATYDEVYESVADDEGGAAKGGPVRRHASFSSRDSDRTEQQAAIKRHASNINQYGRYGKLRAEDDARRYVMQQTDLERQKDVLRRALNALRAERKTLKDAKELKDNGVTDVGVERRLVQLEALCRQKEEERVELELKLTQVKENLNKSLARGAVVAPPTQAAINAKVRGSKTQKLSNNNEIIPVNSAAELRKRPPSLYASSKGNVMQKAKEWESKTCT
ncbi:actin filament-associated protein 1-like 1 isoform X2 [Corythoichthys intestinalis]|uniref:actin filament-associated protein 1-like 1 isoform X2 n=1 Tax=Corythoichthys intestinalis TaxID=161448 RepID=UPI0025A52296|nr:actin filament-associated protein 1-like 1 isoform X2 [Corythoichthys intestinalis]XP_061801497.1 actin filament-associated protein 1-like 1 [Nerophis lumbriciformis]